MTWGALPRRKRPGCEAPTWPGRSPGRGPEIVLCLIELAKLRLVRGEDARALIDEAKALQPNNMLVRWIEARMLAADGQYTHALAIFGELANIDPDTLLAELSYDRRMFGASAFAEMGYCAFRMGRYAESESWYRRAEALEPGCLEFRVKRQLAGKRAAPHSADATQV